MTNSKFRISFEITDNIAVEGFRNFIKLLLSDDNKFDVYIISNDDNSMFIHNIAIQFGIDSRNVIITNFQEDKLQAIISNNIDIHLDNLQSFVIKVNELTANSYGVLITKNLNKFYLQPDYVLVFEQLLRKIESEQ